VEVYLWRLVRLWPYAPKRFVSRCPLWLVTVVPIADAIETTPRPQRALVMSLAKSVLIFLLRRCVTVSATGVVLNFLFHVPLNKESVTPTFARSLGGTTFSDLGSFRFLGISEAIIFRLPGL
jgi:hypothetical protein